MNRMVVARALPALLVLLGLSVPMWSLHAQDPGTPVSEQTMPVPSAKPSAGGMSYARPDPAHVVFPRPALLIERKPNSGAATKPEEPVELELYQGETRVIPVRHAGRLAVGNGTVLSATVLDKQEILIIANQPGVSSLYIWTKEGRSQKFKVTVQLSDARRTGQEILAFLSKIPEVKAHAIGDKILIEGDQISDQNLERMERLAKAYPQVVNFTGKMGWERMIQMDVRVVEISRDKLRDLGIKWNPSAQGPAIGMAGDLKNSGIHVIGQVPGEAELRAATPYIPPFRSFFGVVSELSSRIQVLEQTGDAVTLAEPQLSTRNGAEAEFVAGGEIPYPLVDSDGRSTVIFRPYGVVLKIKPQTDGRGAIRSSILAEVSEPDSQLSVNGMPGIRKRSTKTEFNVAPGQTMVLSGIIHRRNGENIDKLPGLGDIPILGALFRSKRFVKNQTELVVFVTPYLVHSDDERLNERRQNIENRAEAVMQPVVAPATVVEPEPKLMP